MLSQLFDPIDSWLQGDVRVDIEPIQIFAMDIHSEVSVKDSINVDHRDDHKDKHLSEHMCSKISFIQKKVYDSLHGIGGRSFPRVNPSCYENNRFLQFERSVFLGEESGIKKFLLFDLFEKVIVVGDRE